MTEGIRIRNMALRSQAESFLGISFIVDAFRINWRSTGLVPLSFFQRNGLWMSAMGRKSLDTWTPDFIIFSGDRETSPKAARIIAEVSDEFASMGVKIPAPVAVIPPGSSPYGGKFPAIAIQRDYSGITHMSPDPVGIASVLDNLKRLPLIPVPMYNPEMPDFMRALLITRNLALKPPVEIHGLVAASVDFAYSRSSGFSRESIRRDLQSFTTGLIKSRTFVKRGNFVYYSQDSDEFRRRFARNFMEYSAKISRRTIFDWITEA
ncbi:MAG: hypothetical protein QXN26_01505 [Thermoplasmataceae archaeon]